MVRLVRMNTECLDRMMTLAGVTVDQLAKDAGVGTATISRARAGRPLHASTWFRIASAVIRYPTNPGLEALLSSSRDKA
jgi:hypothetical protein